MEMQLGGKARGAVRLALREMPESAWRAFREKLNAVADYPSREDDLRIAELILRDGYSPSEVDTQRKELGIKLRGDSRVRLYRLMNRMTEEKDLLAFVKENGKRSSSVKDMSRENIHYALVRMQPKEREAVIELIPHNPRLHDSLRDRRLASDYFGSEMTYEELVERYRITESSVRTALGKIMNDFKRNERANAIIGTALKSLYSVPPLDKTLTRKILYDVDEDQMKAVFDKLHRSTWHWPSKIDDHLETAALYLHSREGSFDRAIQTTGHRYHSVATIVAQVIKRVTSEPEARRILLAFVYLNKSLREKYLPVLNEYYEQIVIESMKTLAESLTVKPRRVKRGVYSKETEVLVEKAVTVTEAGNVLHRTVSGRFVLTYPDLLEANEDLCTLGAISDVRYLVEVKAGFSVRIDEIKELYEGDALTLFAVKDASPLLTSLVRLQETLPTASGPEVRRRHKRFLEEYAAATRPGCRFSDDDEYVEELSTLLKTR